MSAFVYSAGIAIINKGFIKDWIELIINSMMDNPIFNTGFMNMPWFWIGYPKGGIIAMVIGFVL